MPEYGSLLHEMTDSEAVEYIQGNYEMAKAQKDASIERNERYLKIYQALDPVALQIVEGSDKPEDHENIWSNTYLPVAAARVDTHWAALFSTLFSTVDYLEMDPDEAQDFDAAAKISAHLMRTHRDMGFKKMMQETLLSMDCFDYAVTLTTWRYEPGFIPKRKTFIDTVDLGGTKMNKRRIEMEEEWVPDAIDRQETYNINYFDCYHDWKAKGLGRSGFEDSRFFFDKRKVPFWVLDKAKADDDNPLGKYKNVDKVREMLENDFKEAVVTPADYDLDAIIDNFLVTVKRCFTKFETVEVVGDYVIRRQKHFRWPLGLWRCFTVPGQFNGMGLVQRVERMQYDVNEDLNSRRNFWNMVTDPATFMSEELISETQGKEFRHGQTYTTGSERPIGELFQMAQPAVSFPPDAMGQLATEISIMDDTMKVSLPMQGRFAPGRRTAAEARGVAAGGDIHYNATADLIEEGPLTRIYELEFRLSQQFMTKEARFKHHGQFGIKSFLITPADYKLTGGSTFMALGARNKEDPIKSAQFLQAFQFAAMFPQHNNLKNLFKSLWKQVSPREYTDFIADETAGADNIPPDIEDQIMAMGHRVEVSPANNHEVHAKMHSDYERTVDFASLPNDRKLFHQDHTQQHMAAIQQQAIQTLGARGMQQGGAPEAQGGEERISQGMSGANFGVGGGGF